MKNTLPAFFRGSDSELDWKRNQKGTFREKDFSKSLRSLERFKIVVLVTTSIIKFMKSRNRDLFLIKTFI